MGIYEILRDTKNYHLHITTGDIKDVVIGVPHHAPLGVAALPCKEHPVADENSGFIGYEVAKLINCNSLIACNSFVDPNKKEDTDYCKKLISWSPKILIEIHGHGGVKANFDIEISSGTLRRTFWSTEMAAKLLMELSHTQVLKKYTVSGNFDAIYFKAKNSFTIPTNKWVAFHIELPKEIRQSKDQYMVFCEALAKVAKDLLGNFEIILAANKKD